MSLRQTTNYSKEFKANAVKALFQENSEGITSTARKFNIATSTLFSWKKKYANDHSMKNENQIQKSKVAKKWSPEQKLDAIIRTGSMSANEIGEFLRANGLHSNDLILFKEECLSGFKIQTKGRPKTDPEVKELRKSKKNLERSLKRTESALAEQSARIILLKKSHEIWGEPEDDE